MNAGRAGFVNWAKKSCHRLTTVVPAAPFEDLVPLADMIGDARIVALSEAVHGAAEPLEFRNRLLRFLVLERGFTAIAIESGLVESRIAHDYVLGRSREIADVVARGFSWTFDRLAQNRWLIEWLADHNSRAGSGRRVNFYGFDIPGSPGEPRASRQLDCALLEALEFLAHVDEAECRIFHVRLETALTVLRRGFGLDSSCREEGYEQLSKSDRDALTAAISDLVTLMERRQLAYTEASSAEHFAWAYRTTLGARQLDGWLRELPLHGSPSATVGLDAATSRFLSVSSDIRDRAQADNLEWILEQEGPTGRVLVFASRFHISATPVWTPWTSPSLAAQTVAGVYLRKRHGKRLVTVGNLIRRGEYFEGARGRSLGPLAADSLDCVAADVGEPLFALDLRAAPAAVAEWLRQEHLLGSEEYPLRLSPAAAFDVVLYMDTVTPA